MTHELQHLGKRSADPIDRVDTIEWEGGRIIVSLICREFTSRCPVTNQPDFGHLVIEYEPDQRLVETKSLKLFLLRFREVGKFNEVIVSEIADMLFEQLEPKGLEVTGIFGRRGGIEVQAKAVRGNYEKGSRNP